MKSIAAKMAQIGKSVGFGVPKDGHNQMQNYDYTSAASVRMAVGPALASRGIAVSSSIEILHREAFNNAKGNRQHYVIIRTTLRFIDSETGESLEVQGLGEGVDSGDKSAAKAQTMAEKYAYVSAFTLAMGEDPEKEDRPATKQDDRLGAEEQSRANAQAADKATAKQEAEALIQQFLALTHVDDVAKFLHDNVLDWDVMETTQRTRVYTRCLKHADSGIVEGLGGGDLKTVWKAALDAARERSKQGGM